MIFGTCTCIAANKQQQHICGMLCWHEPNNMWNAILARAYALQSVTLQMVEWQRFKWTAIVQALTIFEQIIIVT